MANITLFVPDELKHRMDQHREVRWSMAVRSIIDQKLNDFEEVERLVQKSRLTEADVKRLADKVNEAAGKHAEMLLHEAGGRR